MAVVTPMREIPPRMERIRYPEVYLRELSMNSSGEIVEERPSTNSSPLTPSPIASPSPALGDEAVYVALGKNVREAGLTLSWALHNSGGRKTVILHVHQPAQKIPMMGANMQINQLEEHRVRAYHEAERQDMQKILDKYVLTCKRAGVQAEKLYIEMDSIERGIVELISLHSIKKLVMGGAARGQYSRKLLEPRSRKAIYVSQQAPDFCQIRFVCKGHLIHTRQGTPSIVNMEVMSPSLQTSPNTETGESHSLKSRSVAEGLNDQLTPLASTTAYRRVRSDNHRMQYAGLSPNNITGVETPPSRLNVERSSDVWDGIPRRNPSVASYFSSSSSSEILDNTASISITRKEGNGNELEGGLEGTMHEELFDRLEQYGEEAEISRREAFEESIKRRKAEREAIEAKLRAKASESKCLEEIRQRKEVEEALLKHKQEVAMMNSQFDEIQKQLQLSMEQKSSLELQIATSEMSIQDLEQKMFSAVELMKKYKKERDDLQVGRDNAVREAEELRNNQANADSSASVPSFIYEYFFPEIKQATRNFDPELKIGEGGYGSIYKGFLHHTQVAIKILSPRSEQGPLEFQQEVNILSKLRHPNLVALIGACPEAWALIYEYLPNGSLEDRLSCKENTPPLSWQTRIRIASELCSVLIFMHSCSPRIIVHGDLKPSNILLDASYVCKLSDFGICRVLNEDEFSENSTTLFCKTAPKGTFAYMDPEFLVTGELTPKSDVYSFGVILLRLLTGKPAVGLVKEVQAALNKEKLKDILDNTAGDWPFVKAKQLANLAMSCCEMSRRNRPDLSSEVWMVLEPMRASCGASSLRLIPEEQSKIPSYFICPIFQELMQDPVIAADGFTYEAEAIRGWLDSGDDTSPMTNLKLTHTNLVSNHALRSAIQEWSQQP